jgi:hypothetical protein
LASRYGNNPTERKLLPLHPASRTGGGVAEIARRVYIAINIRAFVFNSFCDCTLFAS